MTKERGTEFEAFVVASYSMAMKVGTVIAHGDAETVLRLLLSYGARPVGIVTSVTLDGGFFDLPDGTRVRCLETQASEVHRLAYGRLGNDELGNARARILELEDRVADLTVRLEGRHDE